MPKSQSGFAPIVVVVILSILAASGSIAVYKFRGESESIPSPSPTMIASSSAQVNTPTPKATNTTKIKITAKVSPTPSAGNSQTNNSQSSSNPQSNNQTNNNQPSQPNSTSQAAAQSPTPVSSADNSQSFSNDGVDVRASCSGSDLNLTVVGNIPSPNDRDKGAWATLVDNSTGQSMIYEYTGNGGSYPMRIAASFPQTGAIRGSSFNLSGDGRSYSVKVYIEEYTNGMPKLDNLAAQVTFNKKCA